MPTRRAFAFALTLVAGAPCLAAVEPAPPALRLPADARPLAVAADLTLVPDRETFAGRVRIELELLRPTRVLWLNAHRLDLDSAALEAGERRIEARILPGGEDFAGFDLGAELPAGPAALTVAYRGRLDAVDTDGLFRERDGEDWYVFSQFEATSARRAFPCFDEPAYRAPWRLTLHVRRGDRAFANTPVVAEREEADGMKAVEFAATPPLPSYLVAVAVGPFATVDAGAWGRAQTPVRIVVPRGREAGARFAAEVTGALLARLEDYFEVPHPFAKLDNVVVPETVGFSAMENPGLITYSDRSLLVDPANAAVGPRRRYASIAAHENAHLWFGDFVTLAWWDDIWLNEGFADWISDKVVTAWRPEWFDAADRVERRASAIDADSLASARPVRRPIRTNDDIVTAFDGISYAKGASLLEMFESWMGAERFRAGIRRYLARHAWGNATSADFLAALGEEGAPEVARAFAGFLDQPGVPLVTVEAVCPEGAPARLDLAQRRYVPLGSHAERAALWSVPLRLRVGAGERVEPVRFLLEGERASVPLPFCPEWVAGNQDGIGYYLTGYRGGLLARLAARAASLPAGERIALLDDAARRVAAGDLAPAEALGLLPAFADDPARRVAEAALAIASGVDEHRVAAAARPAYERFLHALFAARLARLGLDPRPGEPLDDALLRPELVRLLAGPGGDRALAAAARQRAEAWLADRSALAPDLVGPYLAVAAQDGDAALFDRLLAAVAVERDARVRSQLFVALGSFRAPEVVEKAIALAASGRFDVREAGWILFTLSGNRFTRPRVFEWVRAHYDEFAPTLPEQFVAYLPWTAAGFCDANDRAAVEEFFRPRAARTPGAGIALGQTLDVIDLCIAGRAAQEGPVAEFLARY